jgi:hypothetical protein
MTRFRSPRIWNLVFIGIILLAACQVDSSPAGVHPLEIAVQEIPLSKPASSRSAEISGMAWYRDNLVLLPQYPHRFGERGQGALFALDKSTILSFIQEGTPAVLNPKPIIFDDGGLRTKIKGFEGFEAIAVDGERVYLTIEASPRYKMKGYIVTGSIQPDLSMISLEPDTLTEIPLEENISNLSAEALIIFNRKILTFYEANGRKVNPAPVSHRFDLDLVLLENLAFPNIEYRLTDAAPPDNQGFFWMINSYFPPDEMKLAPQEDLLAERYGQGITHAENLTVERLVQFQVQDDEIIIVDQPPLQLLLEGDVAPRNWEAVALLDKLGFLLATDKFPRTILGFVPFETSK